MICSERISVENKAAKKEVTHYSVNGEPQETVEKKLTVRVILTNAGFTPAEDYELTSEKDKPFKSLDEEVNIKEGEKFTATFVGPTPTS